MPLEEARERIRQELDQEQAHYDALTAKALKLGAGRHGLADPDAERVLIEGTGSFLEQPEFADVERMRALFKTLEEKHKLLRAAGPRAARPGDADLHRRRERVLLRRRRDASSPARTAAGEQVLGTVGVIGPTRMNYQRVIPLVNFTAQVLSRVLDQG